MKVRFAASQILADAQVYLEQIGKDKYQRQLDLLFGASIGQHTRHFIEFFQCLLDQIGHASPEINYAARARDLVIETDPEFANTLIDRLRHRIEGIAGNVECRLVCTEHFEETEKVCVDSSLERELIYNIEHTIHHLAIIKIGLALIAPDITLPRNFGVAPSTVRYKEGTCAQ